MGVDDRRHRLGVTVRTWLMIASPLFGSLVSTSTTPACVTNTVVFPPAPGITYRLSPTFLIVPVGGMRGGCCCAASPRHDDRWKKSSACHQTSEL
jgi:hypothetical protein